MLRMILADDEPVITRGIKKLVDWAQLGVLVVGEYENGSNAMEGILTEKPDIALLDISMPGMSGIEILKSIRKMELPTKVIFISGFQDFEYAKSAITYGAVDYLLKPVIREELLQALEKAVLSLPGKKQLQLVRPMPTEEKKSAHKTILLEETTYLPVLVEILFTGTETEQEKKLIRFSVSSFLESYLAERKLGILFSRDTHMVVVLKGTAFNEAKEILLGLQEEGFKTAGRKTAFVIGQVVDNMGQIPEEYEKCLEMSRYFFFEDYLESLVLTAGGEVYIRREQETDMATARERMLETIVAQNQEDFVKAFEEFAWALCFLADGRKEDACYYFCSTVRIVEEKIQELHLEGKNPDIRQLLEQGRGCPNFARMKEYFKDYLEGYLVLLRQTMENNDRRDIVRAKEYIEEHFRENLTLEVLAGVMYMNPYYFSSFFKKNAGENFKDYVNRVRIKHAVSLLVTTDMKTYEIAEETGFRDVRSFTDAFSRAYGETPVGYRKRVLDGKKGERR